MPSGVRAREYSMIVQRWIDMYCTASFADASLGRRIVPLDTYANKGAQRLTPKALNAGGRRGAYISFVRHTTTTPTADSLARMGVCITQ